MNEYRPRLKRLDTAFECQATTTSLLCACGRVHFTDEPSHGDFEDGELEELIEKSERDPDMYVRDSQFGRIDWFQNGEEQLVLSCPCGKADRIAKWIEGHAEGIARYLHLYFVEVIRAARRQEGDAQEALKEISPFVDGRTEGTTPL